MSGFKKAGLTFGVLALMAVVAFAPASIAADPPEPITDKVLLDYLEDVTSWRRDIAALDTVPGNSLETLLKNTLQKNSIKILKYGFEFARVYAPNLDAQKMGPQPDQSGKLSQQQEIRAAARQVELMIPELQKKIAQLNTEIARTPFRKRPPLMVNRDKLSGELKLALARQDLLKSVTSVFSNTESEEASTLTGKVENLARTLPELDTKTKKPATDAAAASATPATPAVPQTVSAASDASKDSDEAAPSGILRLGSDMFALNRKKEDLNQLLAQTELLSEQNQELIDYLRLSLKSAVERGDQITDTETRTNTENLNENVDAIVSEFKQLSAALIPLGQAKYWLSNSAGNIKEWQESLDAQMNKKFRTMSVRLVILGIALLVPLMISEALRRTTIRYVQDNRRRRQLHMTRRIVFGVIVGMIILLNIVTEFGSLATYIGLLTAGLAVALQNVILSMVSYFFYFGRFGVRVGDRVTIGNVTGEVVQIGLIRLYLMELGGPDSELYPTGKIIAYPNSILFQPAAFSKQVPGTNYTWRKITFSLDANTDYRLANKKVMEAVQAIYDDYHEIMDHQQDALIRATHMNVKIPPPRGTVQFTEAGLSIVIRYPIEISRAMEINERITKKIMDTLQAEPSLRIVSSNPPRIQPVTSDDN